MKKNKKRQAEKVDIITAFTKAYAKIPETSMRQAYSDCENSQPAIREAVGYADLGMWTEAAASFKALPVGVRFQQGLHRLRLRVATGVKDFSAGYRLAWLHPLPDLPDREAAGRYLLGHAQYSFAFGNQAAGHASTAICCVVWPEGGIQPPKLGNLPAGIDGAWIEALAKKA